MANNTPQLGMIISIFRDLALRHKMINDFFVGERFDIGASNPLKFPYLWLSYDQSVISGAINSNAQTITYVMQVAVMDKIKKGDSNYDNILSDTHYILSTIISEMAQHQYYANLNIKLDGDIVFNAAQEFSDDNSNGWIATFKLKVPMRYTYCNSPIEPITGYQTSYEGGIATYRLEGAQGPQGPQGLIGFRGFQGFDGTQGSNGPNGSTGSQGEQGFQGFVGEQGFQGLIGAQGNQGFQGSGDTGSQGLQGFQGYQGQAGIDAANSFSWIVFRESDTQPPDGGFNTSTSTTWDTLINKPLYINQNAYNGPLFPLTSDFIDVQDWLLTLKTFFDSGSTILFQIRSKTTPTNFGLFELSALGYETTFPSTWDIRFSSVISYNGSGLVNDEVCVFGYDTISSDGATGSQGSVGLQGFQGRQGVQGLQGLQGVQGFQGSGNTGSQGFQGFQGFQGLQGAQGSQGFQGSGNTGSQGFQGFQGQSSTSNITSLYINTWSNSGTGTQYVGGSTFSYEPNSMYIIHCYGTWRGNNSSTNPTIGMSSSVSGPTASWWWRRQTTTAPTLNNGVGVNGVSTGGASTITANTDLPIFIDSSLITDSSSGFFGIIITVPANTVTIKDMVIQITKMN